MLLLIYYDCKWLLKFSVYNNDSKMVVKTFCILVMLMHELDIRKTVQKRKLDYIKKSKASDYSSLWDIMCYIYNSSEFYMC